MNWNKLREKFFNECVDRHTVPRSNREFPGYTVWINLAPHDLFEWFKRNIENEMKNEN